MPSESVWLGVIRISGQTLLSMPWSTCKLPVPYFSPLGFAGLQDVQVHLGLDLVFFGWCGGPRGGWDRDVNRFDVSSTLIRVNLTLIRVNSMLIRHASG